MTRGAREFIREDESRFEDGVVCSCSNCGDQIRMGGDMMVFVSIRGEGIRLCEKCYNNMTPDEVLELAEIWNQTGDSYSAESALMTHLAETDREDES